MAVSRRILIQQRAEAKAQKVEKQLAKLQAAGIQTPRQQAAATSLQIRLDALNQRITTQKTARTAQLMATGKIPGAVVATQPAATRTQVVSQPSLEAQLPGIQSQIDYWQGIANTPNVSPSYKQNAQYQIGSLQQQYQDIQRRIEQQRQQALQPVTVPERQGVSYGAEYAGLPTVMGGTYGNTPQTLARQIFAGGYVNFTVQTASGVRPATAQEIAQITQQGIAQLTPKQQEQYKAELDRLQAAPGNTPQEKLAVVERQTATAVATIPIVERTAENIAKAIEVEYVIGAVAARKAGIVKSPTIKALLSDGREVEAVQLLTGELMTKADFNALSSAQQAAALKGGYDAIYVKTAKGEYIDREWFVTLTKTQQDRLLKEGVGGLKDLYAAEGTAFSMDNVQLKSGEFMNRKEYEALPEPMRQEAMAKGLAAIDLSKMSGKQQVEKMKQWGMVDKDAEFDKFDEDGQVILKDGRPLHERILNVEFAKGLAVGMIPIAGTWYFWDRMKPWERGLSVALDVATLIPFVGAVSVGVRGGKSVGVALGRAMLAEVKAPITAITHPVATMKAGARPIELLFKPRELPLASAEIRTYFLKIPEGVVKDIGGSRNAMEARDALTKAAIMGEKPVIQVAGKEVELSKVAMQQKLQPLAIHTSPDLRPFMEGATVQAGREGEGLFIAPTLNSRLSSASAFGAGMTPTPEIGAFEWTGANIKKLGKYSPQDIAGLDLPAVRDLNLADAKGIPEAIAPRLQSYIQRENGTVVGSFAEWLRLEDAPRPHDVDLNFANPEKARNDIADIVRQAGYKPQIKESAVLAVDAKGKVTEIANVKGARDSFFKQHSLERVSTAKINGVSVIPLGEQYLRQGFGAITATDKATFAKRANHMLLTSPQLKRLVKEAGFTEKMPGALLIRDENVLAKMRPSGKLYRGTAEIEQTIKAGTQLPAPSQILTTRDAAGEKLSLLVIGKPFTQAELTKFKLMGAVDTVRDIFRPAMKIDGEAVQMVDELNDLAREGRAFEKRIKILEDAGDIEGASKARAELRVTDSRARAITRQVDARLASRTSLRLGAVSTGYSLSEINYNELARIRPDYLGARLAEMPRANRAEVIRELAPQYRARIQREVDRIARGGITRGATVERGTPVSRGGTTTTSRTIIPGRVPTPGRTTVITPSRTGIVTRGKTPIIPRSYPVVPEPTVPPPVILGHPKSYDELTPEQKAGAVAWKQGFIYKLTYPPYGQNDIFNTDEPIPGVEYHKGIGSAAKSIVTKHGDIPAHIRRDMGIVDINIFRSPHKRKPTLRFKSDPKGKTEYAGIVSAKRR